MKIDAQISYVHLIENFVHNFYQDHTWRLEQGRIHDDYERGYIEGQVDLARILLDKFQRLEGKK
jgi:hypothetical protein